MTRTAHWRGLVALVQDAVENASHAIERVHRETAGRSFDVLEKIPPVAVPTRGIRALHDATVASVHGVIRLVNRVAGGTAAAVLEVVERGPGRSPPAGGVAPR